MVDRTAPHFFPARASPAAYPVLASVLHVLLVGGTSTSRERLVSQLRAELDHVEAVAVDDRPQLLRALTAPVVDLIIIDAEADWIDATMLDVEVRSRWPACEVLFAIGGGRTVVELGALSTSDESYLRHDSRRLRRAALFAQARREQREAQDRIQAVEAHLQAVVDAAPSGIIAYDDKGRVELFNAEAERIFGIKAANAVGKSIHELLPRVEGPDTIRGVHVDGSTFPVDLALREARVLGKRTFIAVLRDVTEQRKSQEALRRSEANFRQLIERSPDGIIVHREGTIEYLNPAMLVLLGVENPQALVGKNLLAIVHESDHGRARARMEEPPSSRSARVEMRLVTANGGAVWTEVASMSLQFDGRAARVEIFRDVTERKRMQTELVRADRLVSLGTLAAGVAHEINNPLAYVTTNLQLVEQLLGQLAQGVPVDEVLSELVESSKHAREGTERAVEIVRELRLLSRPQERELEPVCVRSLLESTINVVSHEIRHRARLVREYDDVPKVAAEASRLSQVFINLLINAAQAIEAGDRPHNEIRVATKFVDGMVEITVTDTGIGIPPELIDRIFDPFFTTKPLGEGTGLGLSISHSIVGGLGGSLTVESSRGAGTTFRVRLRPADQLPQKASAAPASGPKRSLHILIVDDEPRIVSSLQRLLARLHRVDVANSGAEALALIRGGERYDAILCDLMMPEVTGMDVFAELAESAPDQARRTVFLTGGAFTARAERFLAECGQPNLMKPCSRAQIDGALQAVSARAEAFSRHPSR